MLQGSDDALTKRVRDLPESAIAGTHYNAKDMERRLLAYREANCSAVAEPSVHQFMKEHCKVSMHCSDAINETEENALSGMKIYIERVSSNFYNRRRTRSRSTS